MDALLGGTKWGGATGVTTALTFSFPWPNGVSAVFMGYNGAAYSRNNEASASQHFGLNTVQQIAATQALQAWANVAPIDFSRVPDNASTVGDIRFAFTSASSLTNFWGYSSNPNSFWPSAGDVWINAKYGQDLDWTAGSYNFEALMHEIGHALGLKHPFEGDMTLPSNLDNRLYTLMSYTNPINSLFNKVIHNADGSVSLSTVTINPETPMLLDIAAIQYLYGANTSYNAGDTTYTFDPQTPFFKTIWDGAGNDTISVSNFTAACWVDLNQGHFSNIATVLSDSTAGYNWKSPPPVPTYDAKNNLCIAYNCVIENVIAGAGDDTIIGNDSNNFLNGGPGNDTLTGAAGNDTLQGGAGNDVLNGGSGTDTVLMQGKLSEYKVAMTAQGGTVSGTLTGRDGKDTLQDIEHIRFADFDINAGLPALAASVSRPQLQRLMELYVGFFNRIPDADGLSFWLTQLKAGSAINPIADSFYGVGVQYTSLTGFSSTMTNADFVNLVYRNVLGRTGGADASGLAYWTGELASGHASHGSLVSTILDSAHTFKGDPVWGWVANLLDNKIAVATKLAVDWGLNYLTADASVANGMAIAKAVTPTDTSVAIALVGIHDGAVLLS